MKTLVPFAVGLVLVACKDRPAETAQAPAAATAPVNAAPLDPIERFRTKYAAFMRRPITTLDGVLPLLVDAQCGIVDKRQEDLADYYTRTPAPEERAASNTGYPPFTITTMKFSDSAGVGVETESHLQDVYVVRVRGAAKRFVPRAFGAYLKFLPADVQSAFRAAAEEYARTIASKGIARLSPTENPIRHATSGDFHMVLLPVAVEPGTWQLMVMSQRSELADPIDIKPGTGLDDLAGVKLTSLATSDVSIAAGKKSLIMRLETYSPEAPGFAKGARLTRMSVGEHVLGWIVDKGDGSAPVGRYDDHCDGHFLPSPESPVQNGDIVFRASRCWAPKLGLTPR